MSTETQTPTNLDKHDIHFNETVGAVRVALSPPRTSEIDSKVYHDNPYDNGSNGNRGGRLGKLEYGAYRGFAGPQGHAAEYRDTHISGGRGPVNAEVVVRDAEGGRSRTTVKPSGILGMLAPRHSVVIDRDPSGRTVSARLVTESKTGQHGDRKERRLGSGATKLAKMAATFALKR